MTGKPLDRARYERMRAAGFSDEDITADGFDIPAADAPTPDAYSRPGSAGRTGVGLLGKVVQGLSMGTADEIGGVMLAPFARGKTFGDKRREATSIVRGILGDAERDAPKASIAAEVGGAVLPIVFGGAPSITAAAAERAGLGRVGQWTARASGRISSGATSAAASGAGNATGGADARAAAALKAALLGGAIGGGIPLAGALASGTRRAVGAVTERGAQKLATRLAAEAATESGRAIPAIEAALSDPDLMGKPLTLMERIGDPARKLARGAKTNSAEAARRLSDLGDTRMPGTAARVMDDVREGLGVAGQTTRQAGQSIDAARQAIGAAEFLPERMAAEVSSPTIVETLMASPIYRKAFEQARAAARLAPDGVAPEKLFGRDKATKAVTLLRTPTLADIEAIRSGLDDILQSGGYTSRTTTLGPQVTALTKGTKRAVQSAKRALLDDEALNAEHAWYAPARAQLAEQHAAGRALKDGGKLLTQPVADVADQMGAMAPRAQEMSRLAVANRLAQKVENSPPISAARLAGGGSGATAIPARMDRLQSMAAPGAGGRMAARLGAEDQIAQTERFLSGQSNTADKLRESEKVMGAVRQVIQGGKGLLNNALDVLSTRLQGNTGRVSSELARILSTLDPAEQQAVLKALQAEQARQASRAALSRALTSRGGGTVAGQSTRGSTP